MEPFARTIDAAKNYVVSSGGEARAEYGGAIASAGNTGEIAYPTRRRNELR